MAVLVTDNKHLYAYHWSFKEFCLVYDFCHQIALIPRKYRGNYYYEPGRIDRKHGMNITDKLNDPNISFYYYQ